MSLFCTLNTHVKIMCQGGRTQPCVRGRLFANSAGYAYWASTVNLIYLPLMWATDKTFGRAFLTFQVPYWVDQARLWQKSKNWHNINNAKTFFRLNHTTRRDSKV